MPRLSPAAKAGLVIDQDRRRESTKPFILFLRIICRLKFVMCSYLHKFYAAALILRVPFLSNGMGAQYAVRTF